MKYANLKTIKTTIITPKNGVRTRLIFLIFCCFVLYLILVQSFPDTFCFVNILEIFVKINVMTQSIILMVFGISRLCS